MISLKREAIWSTPVKVASGRCEWRWCWRRATQMCRGFVPAGDRIISLGRWHCDRHTEERKALNLKVIEEVTVEVGRA